VRQSTIERYDLIHDRMSTILYWIIPFERPKMQAIGPESERTSLQRVEPDFSRLTDAELTALEKILLKVGGATAAGPAIGADNAGRPASGTATPAADRAAQKNRTELR
jgi:hypothetical protein